MTSGAAASPATELIPDRQFEIVSARYKKRRRSRGARRNLFYVFGGALSKRAVELGQLTKTWFTGM